MHTNNDGYACTNIYIYEVVKNNASQCDQC